VFLAQGQQEEKKVYEKTVQETATIYSAGVIRIFSIALQAQNLWARKSEAFLFGFKSGNARAIKPVKA
jgi:hypothetical protein